MSDYLVREGGAGGGGGGGPERTVTKITRDLSAAFNIDSAASVLVGIAALNPVPADFTLLRIHFGEFSASALAAADTDTGITGMWFELTKREFDGLAASAIGDGLIKERCRVYRDFYDADVEGSGAFTTLTARDVAVARDADRNLLFALGNTARKCRGARVEVLTETDYAGWWRQRRVRDIPESHGLARPR